MSRNSNGSSQLVCRYGALYFLIVSAVILTGCMTTEERKISGIHQYEHVDGMITFSKGIMTFYRMDDSDTADSKKSEPNPVVGWGRYQIMPGRRLVLDVEYSNSVNFANKQINFEYEWLDDSRVRYWILRADGNRSNVMGTSKKMN
jgi:hypothetical protein